MRKPCYFYAGYEAEHTNKPVITALALESIEGLWMSVLDK